MVVQIFVKGLIKHLLDNRELLHMMFKTWVDNHFHELDIVQK